jgi:hypothetical protein
VWAKGNWHYCFRELKVFFSSFGTYFWPLVIITWTILSSLIHPSASKFPSELKAKIQEGYSFILWDQKEGEEDFLFWVLFFLVLNVFPSCSHTVPQSSQVVPSGHSQL